MQSAGGVLQNLTDEGITRISIKIGVSVFGLLFSRVFVFDLLFPSEILFPEMLTFLLLSLEKENFIVSGVGMG